MSTRKTPSKKLAVTISDFETDMNKLNALIEKMETGQLSLESSLQCFEEGITLIKQCQKTLGDAEQKIQILTGKTEENPNEA